MDKVTMEIGGRIRFLRKALKLTQAQVAEIVGIDSSFYGQIERGANVPSLKTLLAIADALSVNPADLLPSKKDKKTDKLHFAALEKAFSGLNAEKKHFVLSLVHDIAKELKR